MQPTIEILGKMNRNSASNKNEVFTRVYRYMLRPDLYFAAYKNLYANSGAATKGINEDTADGFSEKKVLGIIEKLQNGTFEPSPSRRIYIKKQNGKMRPLGIPTFTDKLVQEVMRMILEAIYEPVFVQSSHGFRPQKSCHTALAEIKKSFTGVKWFIEGDIKGCFDNINHGVLVNIVKHNTTTAKIIKTNQDGRGNWGIAYQTKSENKRLYFANYYDCKQNSGCDDNIRRRAIEFSYTKSSLERKLEAKVCEMCGKSDVKLEFHHVNKVKSLKGKALWEQLMIAKRRKTLAVCSDCHKKIHNS